MKTQDQIEQIASKVHDAWWDEKAKQGFHSPMNCNEAAETRHPRVKTCDKCHCDMYPYGDLPDNVKEYDRVMVRTVLAAMEELEQDRQG